MSEKLARSYLVIASAILIAGVLISGSFFVSVWERPRTTTPAVETSVSTLTVTSTGAPGTPTAAGGSNPVTVFGNLVLPTDSPWAVLVLNIINTGEDPITSIVVTFPMGTSGFTGNTVTITCMGETAGGSPCVTGAVPFTFNGASIKTSNPLTVGSQTTATTDVAQTEGAAAGGLIPGQVYTISLTVTFPIGNPQTESIALTAQVS